MPRWLPALLATTPLGFVASNGLTGVLASLPVTVATIALGWYLWADRAPERPRARTAAAAAAAAVVVV